MDLSCPGGWLNCHPIGQFLTIGIQWDSAVAEKPKLRRWRKKNWPKKITGLRLVANGQELQLKGWKGFGWVDCGQIVFLQQIRISEKKFPRLNYSQDFSLSLAWGTKGFLKMFSSLSVYFYCPLILANVSLVN